MSIDFTKVAGVNNQWQAQIFVDRNAETDTETAMDIGAENNEGNTFTVEFSNLGMLLGCRR